MRRPDFPQGFCGALSAFSGTIGDIADVQFGCATEDSMLDAPKKRNSKASQSLGGWKIVMCWLKSGRVRQSNDEKQFKFHEIHCFPMAVDHSRPSWIFFFLFRVSAIFPPNLQAPWLVTHPGDPELPAALAVDAAGDVGLRAL